MRVHETVLLSVACVATMFGCGPAPEETGEVHHDEHEQVAHIALSAEAYAAAGVVVGQAVPRRLVPIIQVTGTLSYDQRRMAIATARIGGRITRVEADFGEQVSAGQVLAWIDSPELGVARADYLRAASMSGLRRAEYDRAMLLLDGEAISRGTLLRREAEWQAAEADRQTAEQKLHILGLSQADVERLSQEGVDPGHEYPVRSPIVGRVTERQVVAGRVVSPNDELFTIADLDSLWLFLQVFEKDLHSVREGAVVTLTCESHPEESFSGTLDFVGQVLDPHSRTVRARAVIDNSHAELMPGMFVYASIEGHTGEPTFEERLALPAAAVASVEGRDTVFVQTDEREFEIRPVELGDASGDWIEIRSGLEAGEPVAVAGVFTLKSEALKGGLEEHHH